MIYRNISEIKSNPKNPRVIKDEKFAKLVQSLKDFPEMLEKRPLVCFTDTDKKLVVLGGNMRLKAANELGLKKLPVILADDWTEEQKAQFLIKDNVGFGEWDFESLANEWDVEQLEDWGLDIPGFDLNPDTLGEGFSLPEGDKAPFQQMTFTLADEQAIQIQNAISDIKLTQEYKYAETLGNENSNGNALYLIIIQWAEQRK
jgi:ParB-like chromosome segregation protein Spo0J